MMFINLTEKEKEGKYAELIEYANKIKNAALKKCLFKNIK